MRVALVIGLASYGSQAEGGLGPLAGPHDDAVDMQEQLESAGFTTILHRDLYGHTNLGTHGGIASAIGQFREQLEALPPHEETVAFFYYSGHGAYNGQHHFLLPNDCKRRVDLCIQGIDFEDHVLHYMVKHARRSIAVLDCCRTGRITHAEYARVVHAPVHHQYLVCHACRANTKVEDRLYTPVLLLHIFRQGQRFLQLVGDANAAVASQLGPAAARLPELGPHLHFSPDFVLVT